MHEPGTNISLESVDYPNANLEEKRDESHLDSVMHELDKYNYLPSKMQMNERES
jgi:hypothetical protein